MTWLRMTTRAELRAAFTLMYMHTISATHTHTHTHTHTDMHKRPQQTPTPGPQPPPTQNNPPFPPFPFFMFFFLDSWSLLAIDALVQIACAQMCALCVCVCVCVYLNIYICLIYFQWEIAEETASEGGKKKTERHRGRVRGGDRWLEPERRNNQKDGAEQKERGGGESGCFLLKATGLIYPFTYISPTCTLER